MYLRRAFLVLCFSPTVALAFDAVRISQVLNTKIERLGTLSKEEAERLTNGCGYTLTDNSKSIKAVAQDTLTHDGTIFWFRLDGSLVRVAGSSPYEGVMVDKWIGRHRDTMIRITKLSERNLNAGKEIDGYYVGRARLELSHNGKTDAAVFRYEAGC